MSSEVAEGARLETFIECGETEKALVSVINYCSDVNRMGKAEFNHWNKYFEEE